MHHFDSEGEKMGKRLYTEPEPMGLISLNREYVGKTISQFSELNDRRHPTMSLIVHFTDGTSMTLQVPQWYSSDEHR
jgi:hypothetical protein